MFESVFIKVDRSLFKSKRNVIISKLYRSPSSDKNTFNTELKKKIFLKIAKNYIIYSFSQFLKIFLYIICIFDGRLQYKYIE